MLRNRWMPRPRFKSAGLSSQREVDPYTYELIGLRKGLYFLRALMSTKL